MPTLLLGTILLLATSLALGDETLIVGNFSAAHPESGLPAQWEPLVFEKVPRHTRYTLVEEDGITVVRADSRAAASGLIRRVSIDPVQYPIVQWRWKIANLIGKSDVRSKEGDDYPARLYITFVYNPDRYTKMFVVQSGKTRVGEWIVEERNILQDYIQAFGEDPPRINGVAIMTDTDNTGEQATAYYGDIIFRKSAQAAR